MPGNEQETTAAGPEEATRRCDLCLHPVKPDDFIRFRDKTICASCKPEFFQRLLEGAAEATGEEGVNSLVIGELSDLSQGIVAFRRNAALIFPDFCPVTEGKSAWRLNVQSRSGMGSFACKFSPLGYLLMLLTQIGSCLLSLICFVVVFAFFMRGLVAVRSILFPGVDDLGFFAGALVAMPIVASLTYYAMSRVLKSRPSLCGVAVEEINSEAVIVRFSNLRYADTIFAINCGAGKEQADS